MAISAGMPFGEDTISPKGVEFCGWAWLGEDRYTSAKPAGTRAAHSDALRRSKRGAGAGRYNDGSKGDANTVQRFTAFIAFNKDVIARGRRQELGALDRKRTPCETGPRIIVPVKKKDEQSSTRGVQDRVGVNKRKTAGTAIKSQWRGFRGGRDRLEREQIVTDNNLGASARYASDKLVRARVRHTLAPFNSKPAQTRQHCEENQDFKLQSPLQMRVSSDPRLYNLPRSVDLSSRNNVAQPQNPPCTRARPLLRRRSVGVRQAKDSGTATKSQRRAGSGTGPEFHWNQWRGLWRSCRAGEAGSSTSAKTARDSDENTARVCRRGDPEKEGNHRVKRESAMWQFSAVSARLVAEQRPSEKAHWVPSRPRARTCGSAASDGDGRKEERVRFIGLRSSRGIPVVFLGYSSRRTQEARDLLSEPTLMGTSGAGGNLKISFRIFGGRTARKSIAGIPSFSLLALQLGEFGGLDGIGGRLAAHGGVVTGIGMWFSKGPGAVQPYIILNHFCYNFVLIVADDDQRCLIASMAGHARGDIESAGAGRVAAGIEFDLR
ncbi:hypothetical protein DFH08DRAFT_802650 [Mycena albidolilacea]|uniref:Uncharacterized protein n=1 Tax=Mycena albidolilacea TaxID=1033008 RepID=A0AAD7AF43_9AGAR|nr:hypothetical protein DFH08DRAFT_802650 [Mycena albidolilacea]